jgi:hypothetical protein
VSKHLPDQLLYSQSKEPQHTINRRLGGPQRRAGCFTGKKNLPPIFHYIRSGLLSIAFTTKIFQNVAIS